jgi:DNA mismatch repair protein MutS
LAKTKDKVTPLMKQYNAIKAKYPDAMLLFRVGDFYETFGKDAIKAANILGIVLTARNNGGSKLELAGFPHHSLNTYLPKLVRAGMRVAICDQLEAPCKEKKIVKRGVTELVTPGVTLNDQILDHKSNNFLAAIHFDKKGIGIAFLDVSTGEFLVAQGNAEYIDKLLHGFKPNEVLFQRNYKKQFAENFGNQFYTFCLDDWAFSEDFGTETLQKHFQTNSLKGFGVEGMNYAIAAAGAVLYYLSDTQHNKIKHITAVSRIEEDKYVWLDRFTIRNLELIYSPNENAKTLIDVLDNTISPMGARLLKRWVALPLKDVQPINERLDVVDYFVKNRELADDIAKDIYEIGDLERLISKVATARINPREVVQLKRALSVIEPIKKSCSKSKNKSLQKIAERLNPCSIIKDKITFQIQDDPPVAIQKGNVIANGVSDELDELRKILNSGKDALVAIQEREIENTGIPSLKIAFNNVFGYYIEVRNTHKDKVPESWHRKQTLTQAERYITEELKEYESKILGADEKILQLETQLFNNLVLELADYIVPIQLNSTLIAQLDCLLSFSILANENHYTRPTISNNKIIDIKDGRHPVIEQQLPIGEEYIANDIYLDDKTQQIMMITGPNMSGKSALLRQTALITLMAQIGSFVPAKHAQIGVVDKIFTRVGASDNISQGESTFMVEMNETASILNNLSDRSLILLDEIGRGTSTYDGISIAWSIAEYLHEQPKAKAKTLFATHYHELNDMTNSFKRIKNYNVSVKEIKNKIIFLRKLVAGGSNHSFGIHVAKMAGMPTKMLNRANEVLKQLESSHVGQGNVKNQPKTTIDVADMQLSFFQLDDPVLEQIKEELINIDINTLTPVEALMKLNEIKKAVGG